MANRYKLWHSGNFTPPTMPIRRCGTSSIYANVQTITTSSANPTPISWENPILDGITIAGSSNEDFTVGHFGWYRVDYTISVNTTHPAIDINSYIMLNGTTPIGGFCKGRLASNDAICYMSGSLNFNFTSDTDKVEIWINPSTNTDIRIIAGSFSITRLLDNQ